MQEAREEFGLVSDPSGKHLYAFGGFNSDKQCLTSIERYDFETN
jgi:hypothetical protein